MGLFDKLKKNKAVETAVQAANDNQLLTQAAKTYCEDKNDTNFLTVLAVLKKAETWVPMMETEIGAVPYILESEDGVQFYPVFSEENQIPTEYAESLTWAQVPFAASAKYIMESTEVSNMLLNAFTSGVVIPEESVRVLMNEDVSERAVSDDKLKLFSADGESEAEEIKRKACAFFGGRTDVKKAYFAKLMNGVEMSYILVVDTEGDSRKMFSELFATIGSDSFTMPIDYTVYPSLEEQLEEIGCGPFFEV